MELCFINTKVCPHCGCTVVVRESIARDVTGKNILVHCNGGRWEEREFLCGHIIAYVPNFRAEESRGHCRFNAEYEKRMEKRRQAEESLQAFIDALDCDEKFKQNLRNHFAW